MEIIEYKSEYSKDFKKLNMDWLEKYFVVEAIDDKVLSDPEKEIINNGGYIFFAILDKVVIGTVALLKVSDSIYELSKMAVTEKQQGKGIGKKLMNHCIAAMKNLKIKKLILYSNTILTPAIELYKKCGFVEVDLDTNEYERSNIKMELKLTDG